MAESERPWPGRMRRTVRAMLRKWQREAWVDSAGLLVSELTTNAFQHGAAADVSVHLALTATFIGIEVDDGTPTPPRPRTAGALEESGRGLLLVAALSDAWGVSPDGTRTWCLLTTHTPEET
ncbi:ATP-binding protein [Streptomyces sp. Ru87]|uniref:ATP-binding protein n=1 Tax=Streptomyces sp. Ru87 TaxID=2044307 RepID=UPI00211D1F21|nr:ATP-binding protein [Streptomyces sp. Ru87]